MPFLAFDTETDIVDLSREIPRMALLTVSDGYRHVVVRPDQLEDFVWAHREADWVGFNVAFDWHVIHRVFKEGSGRLAVIWKSILDEGRLRDAMLLDFLHRVAEGRDAAAFAPRNLGQAVWAHLGLEIDKTDPYRKRFGEIIGVDWAKVDPGFFHYAMKDTIGTHMLYARLMQKVQPYLPKSPSVHGPLTEGLQTRAAVVLADVGRQGMALETSGVTEAKQRLLDKIGTHIEWFNQNAPEVLDRYRTNTKYGKKGDYKKNVKTGTPHMKTDALRSRLIQIAENEGIDLDEIPKTAKGGKITTALDPWKEIAPFDPLIVNWVELSDTAKLHQFLCQLGGKTEVNPTYRVLVRTGRTSCSKPNVQQMPREPWLRGLFVARPGKKLVIVDYSAIELRTLGAVCLDRYGRSVLADTIKAGRDPHAYTAALVRGVTYESFVALKKTDPVAFKAARQSAKAINFGVPGGLGAVKLQAYAKANYGVEMSQSEAVILRNKLIHEVYPELSDYLSDDLETRLAHNLGCSVKDLRHELEIQPGEDNWGLWLAVQSILQGQTRRKDGQLYNPTWRSKVWDALIKLNTNPDLDRPLKEWRGGPRLYRQLCGERAVTLTGRVRSGASYCEARNTPFQGLAADGAKVALWNLWVAGFKIIAFIHDEVVVEVDEDTAEVDKQRIEQIMITSMASVLQCDIPVEVEGHISDKWEK